jgi:hypothetical protein
VTARSSGGETHKSVILTFYRLVFRDRDNGDEFAIVTIVMAQMAHKDVWQFRSSKEGHDYLTAIQV